MMKSFDDSFFCENSSERLRDISSHQINKLGKGAFGMIKGDGVVAVKEMKAPSFDDDAIDLMNGELATMIAFADDYDIVGVIPQGCYSSKNYFNVRVLVAIDEYMNDFEHQFAEKYYDAQMDDIYKVD